MDLGATVRRTLMIVAVVALVAGCAQPQESGPTDLNTDKDRDGIPDDEARDLGNLTANETVEDPGAGGAEL